MSAEPGLGAAGLLRLAGRLAARQWTRFLFFSACLSLGVGFLVAVSHLLAATDRAVALRSRELLAGDVEVRSARAFGAKERAAFAAALTPGRRSAEATGLSSMLGFEEGEPVLVSVKAVDAAYPLRGALETDPPGGTALLSGGGKALVERPLALQRGLEPGDRVRLGAATLTVAGVILKEPDRGFGGFAFAPRLMISNADLPAAGLLGFGARVRRTWTIALRDDEDPAAGSSAVKAQLEAALPEPHIGVGSYKDGEEGVRDGLRRAALFFTVLSLAALLLGAAGLRAGLTLFLDAQADTMGLLRCLGASAKEVERLYAGLCVGAGLLGGALGGAAGWGVAALASRLAPRFGVELAMPPDPASFAEGLALAAVLSWGLSAARVRALASRPPLDALRATPPAPKGLVIAGWALAGLAVSAAAWRRAGSTEDALKLVGALALGALAVELLSRVALRAAAWALRRASALPLPARHGLRRLVRRPGPSRVMLFTLAGGFALLAAVATAREGLGRTLGAARAVDAPDLFLVDVQPSQLARAQALSAGRAGGAAEFAPLVRARLTAVDGRRVRRGEAGRDGPEARERRRLRAREYNLTYADALRPSERVVAGRFWKPGATEAEASVEKGFLERAGLRLGSRLTFEVSGREVEATVTSVREVDWASMRPNFFVTLTPPLLAAAPQTYIASFKSKSPEDAAALRAELSAALPNVSVIDAAALVARVQEIMGLLLAATGALALFCVGVGALVTAGLAALGAEERSADAALERALGWTPGETLAADAAELGALGALSAAAASLTAVGLGWAVAKRLGVPFAADPREAAALAAAAMLLPLVAGLLAGAAGRRRGVMDALRHDG